MKSIVIILGLGLMLVGCAKPSDDPQVPPPKSQLSNLTIKFNTGEQVALDRSYGTINVNFYDYSYVCSNCVVNGISYYSYGCSSHGSWKDLNPGLNRGKACFRVESTTCNHNYKGLIVSYEYSLIETYSGKYVTAYNELIWDKDCNF